MWTLALVTLIFCLLCPASAGDIALHSRAVNEPCEVSHGQGPDQLACAGDPPRLALGSASWASRVVGAGDTAVLRCPVQGGHQLLYRWYKVSRDIIIIIIIIIIISNTEYVNKKHCTAGRAGAAGWAAAPRPPAGRPAPAQAHHQALQQRQGGQIQVARG